MMWLHRLLSEDDEDEPLTVSLTVYLAFNYSYYLGLFERDHPSNYQEGCMQWPNLSLSRPGYRYGPGNSLSIGSPIPVCKIQEACSTCHW
jgi:hypothetical protein